MSDKHPRKKSSLVDYSKISDRPAQDERFQSARPPSSKQQGPAVMAPQQPAARAAPAAMSSQMNAVVRLMTGQEERTIAEKFADANRPTWEQYKKDNQDKLNLEGMDEKKMEEYRRQLDAERDERLAARGGISKKRKKHKKRRKYSSDEESEDDDDRSGSRSDSSSYDRRRRRKKHKKKHKKKRKKRHRRRDDEERSDGDDGSSYSSGDESDRRHNKRKKKHRKRKRKERKEQGSDDQASESDGSHYKLSNFFAEGSQNDS